MKATGNIIVLAYPDTFVKMSTEFICTVLPFFGLGTKEFIKAGHAALILIHNETGEALYYDFGRYVTPPGKGRVRGANTDYELHIPFKGLINDEGKLNNLSEFLLWLDANPQKTHGSGRLLASVCEGIDYDKSKSFIDVFQQKGSIPYGAFQKGSSNCARFVTDTILAGTKNKKVIKALQRNKKFTPSTVGNVEKSAVTGAVYQVLSGVISNYEGSAFKENLTNYFDKKTPKFLFKDSVKKIPPHYHLLEGTGSSSFFEFIDDESLPFFHYRFKRYSDLLEEDFDGVFYSESWKPHRPYSIIYDSHCHKITVFQSERKLHLEGKGHYSNFSKVQQKTKRKLLR